jgi:hypothetical protein
MLLQVNAGLAMLMMTIGLLPDACWTPVGRTETGNSLRQDALDPGFMAFRPARRTRTVMLMVPA